MIKRSGLDLNHRPQVPAHNWWLNTDFGINNIQQPHPLGQIIPVTPSLGDTLSARPMQKNPAVHSSVQKLFPSPSQYLPTGQSVHSSTLRLCILSLKVPETMSFCISFVSLSINHSYSGQSILEHLDFFPCFLGIIQFLSTDCSFITRCAHLLISNDSWLEIEIMADKSEVFMWLKISLAPWHYIPRPHCCDWTVLKKKPILLIIWRDLNG